MHVTSLGDGGGAPEGIECIADVCGVGWVIAVALGGELPLVKTVCGHHSALPGAGFETA